MDQVDHASKVTANVHGQLAREVRRVAALLPDQTVNAVALRAIERGLPEVERELREAARALVEQRDPEGL